MTPAEAAAAIRAKFGLETTVAGRDVSVTGSPEQWQALARFAQTELGCRYFNWLTAVDWKEQGFDVLCRVEDLDAGLALTLRTRLGAGSTHCPTLTGIYRGADWMERECYDMFGVVFDGHPDLRRILLPQDWEGHPLRKDYAVDTAHPPYR